MSRLPFHFVFLCFVASVGIGSITAQMTHGAASSMGSAMNGGGMSGVGMNAGGMNGGGMNGGGMPVAGMSGAGMNSAGMNNDMSRGMGVARGGPLRTRRNYYPYQNMGIMMLLGDVAGDFCPQGYFLDIPRPCPCGVFEYCIFGHCCALTG